MPNIKHTKRYILDCLYGVIYLPDFIWDVLFIPELQRLRELRLCNINSLCFTGGANINRYEHSIGTCYLAIQCLEANYKEISDNEKKLFVLAALFHDIYNAAFGHSLEYVEGFSPENLFYFAATGKKYELYEYKHASYEPIYFGMCEEISVVFKKKLNLSNDDIEKISSYIRGEGEFGKLLSGSMDLDNIDNVYRLAFHMGLISKSIMPIELAKSISLKDGKLFIKSEALPYVENWTDVRKRLYKFLLLNPDEFSAKYMLTEAVELSKEKGKVPFTWHDTDFQLLEKLSNTSSNISLIISNLMKGNLYGCISIYTTKNTHRYKELLNLSSRDKIESELNYLIKPEVHEYLTDFSIEEQKVIKGIKGISYDLSKKLLKITQDININTLNSLTKNELNQHKGIIESMYQRVREKVSLFKIKSPIFGIHPILDINKTERSVQVCLANNESKLVGSSSNCLHVGVFLKNKEFLNLDINNTILSEENLKNITNEIKNFFNIFFEDADLLELELYGETEYE